MGWYEAVEPGYAGFECRLGIVDGAMGCSLVCECLSIAACADSVFMDAFVMPNQRTARRIRRVRKLPVSNRGFLRDATELRTAIRAQLRGLVEMERLRL